MCFYGGHSTGYKLGNHPKNIEPCAHRARTVRAPCAHRATTPPWTAADATNMAAMQDDGGDEVDDVCALRCEKAHHYSLGEPKRNARTVQLFGRLAVLETHTLRY